jgi:choline dehydrogenase-like flavoprotein
MSLGNDGWGQRIEAPAKTLTRLVDEEHLFGAQLRNRLRDHLTRQFRISFSTELLPDPENRVTLSTQVDDLGIPKPALAFAVPDYNVTAFTFARDVISRIFAAIAGTDVRFNPTGRDFTGAGHILGTCRMGDHPATSVVDANCRSHDHPNLFIVGGSVFPTAGTANPTLTAVALTLRAVDTVIGDLRQGVFPT